MSRGFGGRVPWSTGWRLRNLSKEMVVDIERLWMGGGEQYAREVLRRGERKHGARLQQCNNLPKFRE